MGGGGDGTEVTVATHGDDQRADINPDVTVVKVVAETGVMLLDLTSGLENLATFGKAVLWKGAQKIRFEEA